MNFFDMSMMASCMIVVVIILRKLLINKTPHQIWCVLWVLVIIRLYIPYRIETKFNFYNGLYYIRKVFAETDLLNIGYQTYYIDRFICIITNLSIIKWIFLFIWFIGIVVILKHFCRDYILAYKLWKNSDYTCICERALKFLQNSGLNVKIEIRQTNEIKIPIAYGVFRPCILLPLHFDQYSSSAKFQMLLHEYVHLKYMHNLLQFFVIFILCVNWFNPIIWLWYHYINRDMEIACDRHVLDILGQTERQSYAMNLIQMAKIQSQEIAFHRGFTKYVIEERIVSIMKYKKTKSVVLILFMLIPTGVASAFSTNDNYVFMDEVDSGEIVISIDETGATAQTDTIFIDYEKLQPFEIEQVDRAVSSINIEGYEYVTYYQTPPATLKVSTKKDGYTYSGTLKLVDLKIEGEKYIGYYSGTLYRQ